MPTSLEGPSQLCWPYSPAPSPVPGIRTCSTNLYQLEKRRKSEHRIPGLQLEGLALLLVWSEVKSLSRVWFFVTPWTVAYQAPPWDFPGKSTGVGCHFRLHTITVTLCESPPLRASGVQSEPSGSKTMIIKHCGVFKYLSPKSHLTPGWPYEGSRVLVAHSHLRKKKEDWSGGGGKLVTSQQSISLWPWNLPLTLSPAYNQG